MVYPSGNIPPAILTAPQEPTRQRPRLELDDDQQPRLPGDDRAGGVHDAWSTTAARTAQLLPPMPAALPVGIDFLGLPFGEPTLFAIGAAYEAATHHRTQPPDFGPLTRR